MQKLKTGNSKLPFQIQPYIKRVVQSIEKTIIQPSVQREEELKLMK